MYKCFSFIAKMYSFLKCFTSTLLWPAHCERFLQWTPQSIGWRICPSSPTVCGFKREILPCTQNQLAKYEKLFTKWKGSAVTGSSQTTQV